MVELSQVSQHSSESGIIGPTPNKTHTEYGVPNDRGIVIESGNHGDDGVDLATVGSLS